MIDLTSQQLTQMLQHNQAQAYLTGQYTFETLQSGISIHGGNMRVQQDTCCHQVVKPYIAFIILLKGELDFAINQQRFRFQAGETGLVLLLSIEQEILFSRYLHQGQNCCKLAIKGLHHWLDKQSSHAALTTLYQQNVRHWQLSDQVCQCVQQHFEYTNSHHLMHQLQQEANILRLLAILWQEYEAHYPNQSELADTTIFRQPENLCAQLTQAYEKGAKQVSSLAQALHMSERTLQRRLHAQLGITVSQWLRHKNMQFALSELRHNRYSIGQIADQCGYNSVSAFSQAFKQQFQCTPAQWRKRAWQME